MAAFNFPNSPSVDDQYTSNGIIWKWDGTVWKRVASDGPAGAQGAPGAQGSPGAQGAPGACQTLSGVCQEHSKMRFKSAPWATYSASDWVTLDKTASAALPTWFPSIASVKFVSDAALFELLEGI